MPHRNGRRRNRVRDYEMQQERPRRFEDDWRYRESDERMAEERRMGRERMGQSRGRGYGEPRYEREFEERPRWSREEWREEPSYRGEEEEGERRRRFRDENEDMDYPERERFGRYGEYESEYYPETETRRMNYGGRDEYDRNRRERFGGRGRDWDQGRFEGQGRNQGRYENQGWNQGRSENQGQRYEESSNPVSFSRGAGDFGEGQRYSASDRFRGQEYWNGVAGGGARYSTQEQSWPGTNQSVGRETWNQNNHSGKGPKGYQRADERIKEDVSEALQADPEIDASEISVQVDGGTVTLTGTVEDRRSKRMAEDVLEGISGVKDVENRIRVGTSGTMASSTTATARTGRESGRDTGKERQTVGTA